MHKHVNALKYKTENLSRIEARISRFNSLLGREVDVIYRGRLASSTISYRAAAGLARGIYFVRAEAGGQAEMRKVVLLK